jgi:hypothetical protein
MSNVFSGFFNNGIVTILLLLIIFASVALLASWIRKILLPETKESLHVDPKKAVKEELDRVLVPLETPLTPEKKPSKTEPMKVKKSPVAASKPSKTEPVKVKKSPVAASKPSKIVPAKAKKSTTSKPKSTITKNANKRRSKVS